jgi:hypothetical protein
MNQFSPSMIVTTIVPVLLGILYLIPETIIMLLVASNTGLMLNKDAMQTVRKFIWRNVK